jgi:hypothetical protein
VTTNASEIADFAASHKRKLRTRPNPRQSVSFAQQARYGARGFAKPPPGG